MLKSISALLVATLISTTSFADGPAVSLLYEKNNALKTEGVKVEASYLQNGYEVGINVVTDEDNIKTWGASLGYQVKPFKGELIVGPYLGLDHYREGLDQTVGSVGVGVKIPMSYGVQLDGRVKYAEGFTSSPDKVEDVVYNIGLTKTF